MNCEAVRQQLGEYSDGEVPVDLRREMEAHVATCSGCANELESIRAVAARFAMADGPGVPAELWSAIERRLENPRQKSHAYPKRFAQIRRYALAACVLLAVLVGGRALLRFGNVESVASASTVDFRILLDALPTNAVTAFEKFLSHYHARPVARGDAQKMASHLDFDIPQVLPGGFRFEESYLLEFGGEAGIAVRYSRNGEFLGTIFHRPVQREEFGTHKDYECVVGKHRGHAVAVGEWKLVHLTDPTTCHCVLSKLDERTELPAVLNAVAPRAMPMSESGEHSHSHKP